VLEATRSIPGEDVTRGLTRVASDHPLARRYPDAFVKATDGPPSQSSEPREYSGCRAHLSEGKRRSASTPSRGRLPLEDEIKVRKQRLAEISPPKRVESESGRRQRVFWSGAQTLLDSMKSREERDREWRELREDAEADEVTQALGRLAREELELDRIDEAWHWN
jgi:hypothetical protein